MSYTGNIILYTGPMFGGKTSRLMADYDKYSRANKKCIFIRYMNDNRYDNSITHNNNYYIKETDNEKFLSSGIKFNEIKTQYLYSIDNIIKDYDVICIDEIQFFEDGYIFCEKWANENKIIRLSGLISTSNRELFPNIIKLLPIIENSIYCSAVCTDNNNMEAYFTDRINTNDKNDILIGGTEYYKPVDRKIWYSNKNNYILFYTKLIKDYSIILNNTNNYNYVINDDKLYNYLNEKFPKNIDLKDCLLICSNKE